MRWSWIAALPRLCETLQAASDTGTPIARLLVRDSWNHLAETIESRRAIPTPSRRDESLAALGEPIAAVLESAALTGAADLRDEAVKLLREDSHDLLACLATTARVAGKVAPQTRASAGLDTIARHCAEQLEVRLAQPTRTDDDWSIDLPAGCDCPLCDTLGEFLADPARRTYEWPLAQERRQHVHSRIDRSELPVLHRTRRTGRPYTLVLTKTDALFERERQARHRDAADLAIIQGVLDSTEAPTRKSTSPRGRRGPRPAK